MTTAAEIQAQLAEAWESAERTQPQTGDTYICRTVRDEISYEVGVAERPILARDYRVLERAKPKAKGPQLVAASHVFSLDHERKVWFEYAEGAWRDLEQTEIVYSDELVDPVPLVEMPERDVLWRTIRRASGAIGVAEAEAVTDAVLELLKGERKA